MGFELRFVGISRLLGGGDFIHRMLKGFSEEGLNLNNFNFKREAVMRSNSYFGME